MEQIKYRESGSAMVEFALIVPLLLTLILGTFEISKMLQLDQSLIVFTRQCARSVFRSCGEMKDDPFTPTNEIQTCLNNQYNDMQNLANLAIPNSEIILSIYDYKPPKFQSTGSGPSPQTATSKVGLIAIDGVNAASGRTQSGYYSKYTPRSGSIYSKVSAEDFPISMMQGSNGAVKNRIGICEVYQSYSPSLPGRFSSFTRSFMSRYEGAIL